MERLWVNFFWKVWSELFIWNGFSVLQFSVPSFLGALPVLLQRCKAWKAPGATMLRGRLVNAAALSQRGKQSFAGFCRGCCYPASPTAYLLIRNVVCKCQSEGMLLFLHGSASSSSPATPCILTCFLSTNKCLSGAVLMAGDDLSHLTRMGRSSQSLLWREGTLQVSTPSRTTSLSHPKST